jgi:hypothetical protein
MFKTNIPGWDQMTPLERMTYASNVEKCEVHDYEPMINVVAKESVMQICKNCLDMQGWIYNWQERE